MTLPPLKLLVPLLVAALVIGGVWDWNRRQPAVQIPALFARLENAFATKDAAEVMACVHRDYDLVGTWPQLIQDPANARGAAQRILAQAFFLGRDEPVTAAVTVVSWKARPDGGAEAIVNLAIQGGLFSRAVPLLSGHRFLVRRSSWLTGAWAIAGHDPIAANLPSL